MGVALRSGAKKSLEMLVRPVRFELTTFCSGGKRSIQTELRARALNIVLAYFPIRRKTHIFHGSLGDVRIFSGKIVLLP